jgi:hypothetical protein
MIRSDKDPKHPGNGGVFYVLPGEHLSDDDRTETREFPPPCLSKIDTSKGGWLVLDASGDPMRDHLLDEEMTALQIANFIRSPREVVTKVAEWNTHYAQLGQEVRLKDMSPTDYEETVGFELLAVCGEDKDLAIAVFNHPDNKGGWMSGDVVTFIKKQRT